MSVEEFKHIEKKMTLENSFDAMKFGSERDLRIALTELRWIKRTKGKLNRNDFETVSDKYKFPTDFLRKGLKGLSYPLTTWYLRVNGFQYSIVGQFVEQNLDLTSSSFRLIMCKLCSDFHYSLSF